jgi:hypothetical protein
MSTKEQRQRWGAKYYAANRDFINAKARAVYAATRDKQIERSRAYYRANPGQFRARARRRYYGLEATVYDQMYESQRGLCAICGKPPRSGRILNVDHDHDTGLVRGLLCHGCNWHLGALGDNLDAIERVAAYLRRANALSALAA